MDFNEICFGCMENKGDSVQCSGCGYREDAIPGSPFHLPPGTVLLDKYLLGRVLGQGGFGITYLAWDLNLKLKLAVKEYFPQELASRSAGQSEISAYSDSMGSQYEYGLNKFLQEAQTLAQFEGHPNIVSVRDYFKTNSTAYFVMNYVEGITLKEYLVDSGGILPVDEALKIITPVLDALKEVHAVQILHRDISPDNVYINRRGQVILLDFGAARQAISDQGRSLSIILKPGYAPEEQYRVHGDQGPWTDIYSVAATLYRTVTGQMPPESLERLSEDKLIPPSKLGIIIAPNREMALLKALSVKSRDRYQTVDEFQAALLQSGPTPSAITPSPLSFSPEPGIKAAETSPHPESIKAPPTKKWLPIGLGVAICAAIFTITYLYLIVPPVKYITLSHSALSMEAGQDDFALQAKVEPSLAFRANLIWSSSNPQVARVSEDGVITALGEGSAEIKVEAEKGDAAETTVVVVTLPTIDWDGGTYTGLLKDEKPHGKGTLTWLSGAEYTGEFEEGKYHGQGTYTSAEGDRYVGEFKEGTGDGKGILSLANGEIHDGEWYKGYMLLAEQSPGIASAIRWSGALFEGEWVDNRPHGEGTLTMPGGEEYTGEFNDGRREGRGTQTFASGNQYVGAFKDDKQDGHGRYTWANGRTYIGEYKDRKRQGQGTWTHPDGRKYVGEWKDDLGDGKGVLFLANGENYEGLWYKGYMFLEELSPGVASAVRWNGGFYEGEWSDNLPQGEGTLTWPDGDEYNGEFKDGKLESHGTYTWASGQKYVGEFNDGVKHGQGTQIWPDGQRYAGEWRNNFYHGHGTLTLANGNEYVGEFKNGKVHGKGTYTWANGNEYVGEWRNNERTGQGTMNWADGDRYEGEWKDSKYHGQGTYTFANGTVRKGRWENDKFLGP